MKHFVWTATGTTVHVSETSTMLDRWAFTLCGRKWTQHADAADVLWHEVCRKCRRAAGPGTEGAAP